MKIKKYIKNSIDIKNTILNDDEFIKNIQKAANVIALAFKNNRKLLIAGNGGSASDSNHIAAEFVSRFCMERKGLCAISLSSNQAVLTAISNDYSFDNVFSRQIEALGNEGDVFIGISTSGKSKNIIEGFKKAKEKKITTIFLTGKNTDFETDYILKVPSDKTSLIQEIHIMIAHIICGIVEEELFKKV